MIDHGSKQGHRRVDELRAADADLDLGPLADQVGYRIRLLQIAAFKDFEEHTKIYGLAPRYFGLLRIVQSNPGLSQTRLAEAIHLMRSSLVPILDKLEAEGLVERRSSLTDRRLKSVWLSAKGKKVIARLDPLVLAHEARMTEGFSQDERAQLLDLLRRADLNLQRKKRGVEAA